MMKKSAPLKEMFRAFKIINSKPAYAFPSYSLFLRSHTFYAADHTFAPEGLALTTLFVPFQVAMDPPTLKDLPQP
jgi:hypothetical protein